MFFATGPEGLVSPQETENPDFSWWCREKWCHHDIRTEVWDATAQLRTVKIITLFLHDTNCVWPPAFFTIKAHFHCRLNHHHHHPQTGIYRHIYTLLANCTQSVETTDPGVLLYKPLKFLLFIFYSLIVEKKNNFVTNRAQPIRAEDQTVQRSGDMRIITDKAGFKPRPSPLKQKKENYTEEAP